MKTNTIKDWVFEPLVEVSKVGAGYIGKSLSQKGQAPGISLSKSPFEYHKNLLMAVRQQVIVANDFLQKEITSLEIQKEKGLPQVVSAKSFKIRQRIERTPFFNVPPLSLFDKKTIEEEMERAMWAQWVGKNFTAKHKQISYVGGMILNTTTPAHFGRPGGTIEDRLTTLKVKIDGKPLDFGNWTTETEAKKLILWGRNYRPKQFGSPLNKRWL